MPQAGLNQMMSLFPGGFMGVYGLTEAGPNGTALHPHEHPRYAGSIGLRGTVISEDSRPNRRRHLLNGHDAAGPVSLALPVFGDAGDCAVAEVLFVGDLAGRILDFQGRRGV